MDGFLTFLVIIGIILKFVNKSNKKEKKAGGGNAPKTSKTAADVFRDIEAAAKKVAPAPAAASAQPSVPAPDISWLLDEEDCTGPAPGHGHAEGASHADDKGCIGGSMAHDTHEGRNMGRAHGSLFAAKAEGPGNLAAKAAGAPGDGSVRSASHRARFSASEMRRAVVTSEILREPVALRGRTARR